MSDFRLGGLVSAPYTAFNSNGDVDLSPVEKQVETLLNGGVKGAFVCGTTGESMSLTVAERMDVAKRWVEVAGKSLKIIVHVGHNCQRDAIELARHAQKVGAAAVAAQPPFFFKPANADQAVEFMRPIAAAAGSLPFYYYHIPSMTGVSLLMTDLLTVAADRIPNMHGIKFTHGDLMDYQRCVSLMNGRFEIAWGVDEMLLGALACGAQSAVGSTYNYSAPLYGRMIRAYRDGDMATAQRCAGNAVEMIAILLKHGVLRTGKATMKMIGVDCGPTRAPVPPLNTDEYAVVRQAYERIGFFDWARKPA